MLNLLKMDLYRLVKGQMLKVALVVMAVSAIFVVSTMCWANSPGFADAVAERAQQAGVPTTEGQGQSGGKFTFSLGVNTGGLEGDSAADSNGSAALPSLLNGTQFTPTFTQMQAQMWLVGGVGTGIVSIVIALLFAADFASGYAKNILIAGRMRRVYYGEKALLVALLSAAFLAFGMLAFQAACMAFGISYAQDEPFAEIAAWFGMAVLVLTAYGLMTAVAAWATRSKAAALAVAIVVSGGMLGGVAKLLFSQMERLWEPLGQVAAWLPCSSMLLLADGASAVLSSPDALVHILVTGGVFVAAGLAATFGVCARQDV